MKKNILLCALTVSALQAMDDANKHVSLSLSEYMQQQENGYDGPDLSSVTISDENVNQMFYETRVSEWLSPESALTLEQIFDGEYSVADLVRAAAKKKQ